MVNRDIRPLDAEPMRIRQSPHSSTRPDGVDAVARVTGEAPEHGASDEADFFFAAMTSKSSSPFTPIAGQEHAAW